MKYLKPIILIFAFLLILFSCKPDPEEVDTYGDMYYKLTGMKANVLKNNSINSCVNEVVSDQVLNTNDKCKYNNFYIIISFDSEKIGGAMIGFPMTYDTIKNIVITSTNDYNETYLRGDTLNNIVKIKMGKRMVCSEGGFCLNINEYLATYITSNICYLDIFFTEQPSEERLHKFIISYEELSGSKFIDTTKAIYIQP